MSIVETAQILGNLSEFIGAIVIVASLIYLAVQVKQNTEHLAAQSRYNNYKGRTDLTLVVSTDNEIFDAYMKHMNGSELTAAEKARFNFYMRSVFTYWEYEFGEYDAGRLVEQEFNPAGKRILFEGFPAIWGPGWAMYKTTAPPRFVEYMDRNIAKGSTTT